LPDVSDSRVTIAIDPGHGGRDPGAVGINGLRETDVVLDISLQVTQILEQQGVRVILTRRDEREIDLEPRVQTANRANANLFVSIHANAISLDRPDVNGVETYYYSDAGQRFAQVIHDTVLRLTNSRDRRVRFARFYVLRNTSMPAVLLEVGFVTGAEDAQRLADPSFRTQMAEAIAAGILQYVQQNF
jgi:N-acetylmuramoyl-L-alanine amidase